MTRERGRDVYTSICENALTSISTWGRMRESREGERRRRQGGGEILSINSHNTFFLNLSEDGEPLESLFIVF